jgi:hypothetical protein
LIERGIFVLDMRGRLIAIVNRGVRPLEPMASTRAA